MAIDALLGWEVKELSQRPGTHEEGVLMAFNSKRPKLGDSVSDWDPTNMMAGGINQDHRKTPSVIG